MRMSAAVRALGETSELQEFETTIASLSTSTSVIVPRNYMYKSKAPTKSNNRASSRASSLQYLPPSADSSPASVASERGASSPMQTEFQHEGGETEAIVENPPSSEQQQQQQQMPIASPPPIQGSAAGDWSAELALLGQQLGIDEEEEDYEDAELAQSALATATPADSTEGTAAGCQDMLVSSASAAPSGAYSSAAAQGAACGAKASDAMMSSQGSTSCGVCLLPFDDAGAGGVIGSAAAAAAPPTALEVPFAMPCCGAHVHVACIEQCVQLRAIRKNCCVCQEPFADDLPARVAAAARAAAEREKAARGALLSALAGVGTSRLIIAGQSQGLGSAPTSAGYAAGGRS